MKQIGNALNDLIEKGVLTEQGLQHNEIFITTVAQASMLAIRCHQQEKLEARWAFFYFYNLYRPPIAQPLRARAR